MSYTAPSAFTTRPTLRGSFGMAASTHWIASQSAMAVLERGGNAFDAAVACAFVLHVVEPHLNGPGGDLVAIVAPAGEEPRVLAGQGAAPRGASVESYRALGLDLVPGAGLLAATAPGAFDAWLLLLRDKGTWEFGAVVEYALHYATVGYPVIPSVEATIATVATHFRDSWPTSAAAWLDNGPQNGTHHRPEWAATLRRLIGAGESRDTREGRIDAARQAWSTGFVAQAIAEFVKSPLMDSSGTAHAGVLTAEDLAEYRATWEEPAQLDFRGWTVLKPGAWTQGPSLLQSLTILDAYDDERLDPSTPLGAHTILETLKLAMADRDAWYGDDDSTPLSVLLSADYAAARRLLIGDTASHEVRPGELPGRTARTPNGEKTTGFGTGEPTVAREGAPADDAATDAPTDGVTPDGVTRGDTCHIDIVDRWGNMISATPSGGWLQSSPHIPGLGFNLGTRLQMTWLEDGLPTSLRPGERPRTTLSPTLLLRDGVAALAIGTPGGDQQDQWQLPVLLRHIVGGYSLQQAIDAPTLHSTSAPESFWPRSRVPGGAVVEERLGAEVIDDLIVRGHVVTVAGPWSLGRVSAVSKTAGLTQAPLAAAANPRGAQGYAVGR